MNHFFIQKTSSLCITVQRRSRSHHRLDTHALSVTASKYSDQNVYVIRIPTIIFHDVLLQRAQQPMHRSPRLPRLAGFILNFSIIIQTRDTLTYLSPEYTTMVGCFCIWMVCKYLHHGVYTRASVENTRGRSLDIGSENNFDIRYGGRHGSRVSLFPMFT